MKPKAKTFMIFIISQFKPIIYIDMQNIWILHTTKEAIEKDTIIFLIMDLATKLKPYFPRLIIERGTLFLTKDS